MNNTRELENSIFELKATPKNWSDVALKLENAARVLRENTSHEIENRYQEYMLWGFCIENLLKGIIASNDKTKITNRKKEISQYSGPNHNLVNLTNTASFKLNVQEELLLKFLTNAILYLGRYPIPKKSDKLAVYWDVSFDENIDILLKRLKTKILIKHA